MTETSGEKSLPFTPKKWRQVLATLISTQGAFIMGTVLGWSSPSLPEIVKSNQFGELTTDQVSWIASLTILGAVFSAIPGGYAVAKMGRKKTIMLLCIPLFLGWIQIIFADSVRMLYFGRFIIGFFGGVYTLAVPVYINEIAEDRLRGQLGGHFTLQLVNGILFTYVHGSFSDWKHLSVAVAGMPIGLLIAFYFIPESPIYLLSVGKEDEAANALKWLRGAEHIKQIEPELKLMKINLANGQDQNEGNLPEENEKGGDLKLKDWLSGPIRKPLIITIVLMIVQQWSGIGIAIIYTVQIFESAAGDALSPTLSTIIVGVAQVAGVGASTFLVDRLGRKVLLISSSLAVTICWIIMGVYFFLKAQNQGVVPNGLGLLPLVTLVAFIIVFSLGLGPIPWMLPGELIPVKARGLAGAIATTFNWLAAFILAKVFEDISSLLGVFSCYWIFAGICLFGAFYIYLVLPETKQKSFEEIVEVTHPYISEMQRKHKCV